MPSPQAVKLEANIGDHGTVELKTSFPPGTRVDIQVSPRDDTDDLREAAASSTDFWNNSWDDEDWDDA